MDYCCCSDESGRGETAESTLATTLLLQQQQQAGNTERSAATAAAALIARSNPLGCEIERRDGRTLSAAEFQREYVAKRKPVMLTGVADDWPIQRWLPPTTVHIHHTPCNSP